MSSIIKRIQSAFMVYFPGNGRGKRELTLDEVVIYLNKMKPHKKLSPRQMRRILVPICEEKEYYV